MTELRRCDPGEQKSPVLRLLELVWENCCSSSWRHLDAALQDALMFAIRHGFRFNKDDFSTIAKNRKNGGFDFRFWGGSSASGHGEGFYSEACDPSHPRHRPNISACKSFEAWTDRRPFFLKSDGKTRRLAVGSEFVWKGEKVFCSSFSADGKVLRTCYHDRDKTRKPFKITHRDLRKAFRE